MHELRMVNVSTEDIGKDVASWLGSGGLVEGSGSSLGLNIFCDLHHFANSVSFIGEDKLSS